MTKTNKSNKLNKLSRNARRLASQTLVLGGLLTTWGCASEGDDGAPGTAGPSGMDGADGDIGPQGPTGARGDDGSAGVDGTDGMEGADLLAPYFALPGESVYPEGIAVDAEDTLYVGSFFEGTIYKVPAETLEPAIFSTGALQNAAGLLVHGNHLLACDNSMTSGFGRDAAVVVLSLSSGEELGRHAFASGPALCNDITVDENGTVYATGSFSNRIYSIAETQLESNDAMHVFSDDALLSANYQPGNFGLNGISFVPDAGVYVASHFTGELFLLPLDENGEAETPQLVELRTATGGVRLLNAPDGLKSLGDGWLMVVEQGENWLSRVDLNTGTLFPTAGGFDNPSTFAITNDGMAWVVNSQLNDFAGGTAPTLPFTVVPAPLD